VQPLQLVSLASALAAVVMTTVILVRNPGQRAIRLVAAILLCSAHWSVCQVMWGFADDPETARRWVQLSSVGWLWLGPLCLHLVSELAVRPGSLHPWLFPSYLVAFFCLLLYTGTDLGIEAVVRTEFGWGFVFGPLFPLIVTPPQLCVLAAVLLIPRLFPPGLSRRERSEARWMTLAIACGLVVANLTEVALPLAGMHVPQLGSTSMLVLGVLVYRSVARNGQFLLAPAAFTRPILEALGDGVALLHVDGRIRTCNRALAELRGREVAALEGFPVERLLPGLRTGAAETMLEERQDLVTETGEKVPVTVSARELTSEGGARLGRVIAVHDLRAVESLRTRLATADRFAAVGELAAGIAHEINSPVAFVRANLTELRRRWDAVCDALEKTDPGPGLETLADEGRELFEESLEGVDRVSAIVREVGVFSHAGQPSAERVRLAELLENAVSIATLGFRGTIERHYAEVPSIECAPQQLKQVFLNLLLNAVQAAPDGRVRLEIGGGGGWLWVGVEDDGGGIDEADLERIFDPFFTTHAESMGLGLSQSYQIVRRHGGEIRVHSRKGHGSRFEVVLPAAGVREGEA